MSYRNITLIIAVVLFCIVFPSARIRHVFTGRYGDTHVSPTLPPSAPECPATSSTTVDHTVCGNVVSTLVETITQNIRDNLALLGIQSAQTVVTEPLTAPSGALAQPPLAAQSPTVIKLSPTVRGIQATTTLQPTHTRTLQRLQTATISRTTVPRTATTQRVAASPTLTTTPIIEATATAVPATATVAPATATSVVLLPRSILDGFRTRMPAEGAYWEHSTDGVYVAVGSFIYLSEFYSYLPAADYRFVACSVTVSNTRTNGQDIYVDYTNFILTDIDGKQYPAVTGSDDLAQALRATRVAPGQRVGGQIAFMIKKFAAPGQLTVSVANMDEYVTRTTQTIELRVWPTVP